MRGYQVVNPGLRTALLCCHSMEGRQPILGDCPMLWLSIINMVVSVGILIGMRKNTACWHIDLYNIHIYIHINMYLYIYIYIWYTYTTCYHLLHPGLLWLWAGNPQPSSWPKWWFFRMFWAPNTWVSGFHIWAAGHSKVVVCLTWKRWSQGCGCRSDGGSRDLLAGVSFRDSNQLGGVDPVDPERLVAMRVRVGFSPTGQSSKHHGLTLPWYKSDQIGRCG